MVLYVKRMCAVQLQMQRPDRSIILCGPMVDVGVTVMSMRKLPLLVLELYCLHYVYFLHYSSMFPCFLSLACYIAQILCNMIVVHF